MESFAKVHNYSIKVTRIIAKLEMIKVHCGWGFIFIPISDLVHKFIGTTCYIIQFVAHDCGSGICNSDTALHSCSWHVYKRDVSVKAAQTNVEECDAEQEGL